MTACGFERSEETQLPELMHASGFSRESQGPSFSALKNRGSVRGFLLDIGGKSEYIYSVDIPR